LTKTNVLCDTPTFILFAIWSTYEQPVQTLFFSSLKGWNSLIENLFVY
jgi:hypothetical protein